MKSEFSRSWVSSVQPRKQRKFLANAPNHIKRRLMGACLDKKLREKYGVRSIEVRKGDEVKIMRGKFAKKQGKVGSVDVKHSRIQIDGVQRAKKGGEKVETWFHPSNVKIVVLDDSDGRRMKRKKIEKGNSTRTNADERGLVDKGKVVGKKDIKAKVKEKKDAHKEN